MNDINMVYNRLRNNIFNEDVKAVREAKKLFIAGEICLATTEKLITEEQGKKLEKLLEETV